MALTQQQLIFVREYLKNGLNATSAAISAGYSEKTAASQGARLLKHVEIQPPIAQKAEQVLNKLDFGVERTLNEVARLAFLDVRKMFEADGSLKRIDTLDDDTAACIAGMEVTELFEGEGEQKHAYGLLKKVKLSDKLSALDKLMRYHALYKDKMEHTGKDGGPLVFTLKRVDQE